MPTELTMVTGLLHRAIVHGQTSDVIKVYRESRAPRNTLVEQQHLVETCAAMHGYGSQNQVAESQGAMNDASKRQRDIIDLDEESVPGWDRVSFPATSANASPTNRIIFEHVNQSIRIPYGLTLDSWSKTMCKMDRVKEWDPKGLSYRALVERSCDDFAIRRYIFWIKQTYGSKGTGEVKKVTPSADLALFLECIDWTPAKPVKDDKQTFVREFE